MIKRILAAMAALVMLFSNALAERLSGVIAARESVRVTLSAQGTLERVPVKPGDMVAKGALLAELATDRTFSIEDGVVARTLAEAGDTVNGTVLEIAPLNRYTIYCTVDSAYGSSTAKLVHAGEAVYIKCTANGTHRGTGVVTQVDGGEYRVTATGGVLLVGETVYLYRSQNFTFRKRIGIGTVLAADMVTYEAEGTLVRLDVEEGEYVQRGELLFESCSAEAPALTAPADGILLSCAAQGATLAAGTEAFVLAPLDSLCVEAQISAQTAGSIAPGDGVGIILAGDPEEAPRAGRVLEISGSAADDGTYTLRIACDDLPPRLGLTAEVEIP